MLFVVKIKILFNLFKAINVIPKCLYHFVRYIKKYGTNCNENQMTPTISHNAFDIDGIFIIKCTELNLQTQNCTTDCINVKNIFCVLFQQQEMLIQCTASLVPGGMKI